jgi:hypothetical protein
VGVPSLTRSRVCSFQFLREIASAVFLGSEPLRRAHKHILLSQFFFTRAGSWLSLYIFDTDYTENTASYSSSAVACVSVAIIT